MHFAIVPVTEKANCGSQTKPICPIELLEIGFLSHSLDVQIRKSNLESETNNKHQHREPRLGSHSAFVSTTHWSRVDNLSIAALLKNNNVHSPQAHQWAMHPAQACHKIHIRRRRAVADSGGDLFLSSPEPRFCLETVYIICSNWCVVGVLRDHIYLVGSMSESCDVEALMTPGSHIGFKIR